MFLLFDLDGTLTDPGIGITNSVTYALAHFSITPACREELYPYIGPPLVDSFQRQHGLSLPQAQQALALYREYFAAKGMLENTLYPGIPALLERLQAAGYTLMVATSKPEEYTRPILDRFSLTPYFTFICGNTLQEERPTKEAVIAHIQTRFPAICAENTRMIGDRRYDIEGAHRRGLKAIGVLYGYGTRSELKTAGAEDLVENLAELEERIYQRLPL